MEENGYGVDRFCDSEVNCHLRRPCRFRFPDDAWGSRFTGVFDSRSSRFELVLRYSTQWVYLLFEQFSGQILNLSGLMCVLPGASD